MTKDEALKMALDALVNLINYADWTRTMPDNTEDVAGLEAIAAIKVALAAPEQKPIAHLYRDHKDILKLNTIKPTPYFAFPVYTSPPQREWVGLTDADVYGFSGQWGVGTSVIKCVEAKLKEKNHG